MMNNNFFQLLIIVVTKISMIQFDMHDFKKLLPKNIIKIMNTASIPLCTAPSTKIFFSKKNYVFIKINKSGLTGELRIMYVGCVC